MFCLGNQYDAPCLDWVGDDCVPLASMAIRASDEAIETCPIVPSAWRRWMLIDELYR